MKNTILTAAVLALAAFTAYAGSLQPGNLAVLRVGDGELEMKLKQSPVFIDEFAASGSNDAPLATIAIPTNGLNTLFINGHAATEGILTRSVDHRLLAVVGYGGVNLLELKGTPSTLDIGRAYCTVDAAGGIHTTVYTGHDEAGDSKMNPRGIVTDGTNNFWGCGNAFGTFYYNPLTSAGPTSFPSAPNSRAIRIISNVLYVTLNGADGIAGDMPAGIYSFLDGSGDPAPLPRSPYSKLKLEVEAKSPYTKIAGFDMNPGKTIAYTADTVAGIQKYVKTGGSWNLAYNFSIPIADGHTTGCFGLVADFSGPAPVIYATTTEGYNGSVNGNRVVRIVDTNATAAVTTITRAGSSKIAYRGIDFTPEMPAAKP